MEQTLAALCTRLNGELIGDGSTVIRGINACEGVQSDELTFAENPQRLDQAMATPAAAIIFSRDVRDLHGRSGIRVQNPKLAFAVLLELFNPPAASSVGVHPSAVLGTNVHVGVGHPYANALWRGPMSTGRRIARELNRAAELDALEKIVT